MKEYLSTRPDILSNPHAAMSEICLTYLNSEEVKALSAASAVIHDEPFLEYCSVYWGIHAKRQHSHNARSLVLELLREYDGHISGKFLLKQNIWIVGAVIATLAILGVMSVSPSVD